MNNQTIKHIVFDIGQVLLHWDPEAPYKTLIPDEVQRKWFMAEVCNTAWNREQDRGREWSDAEDLLIVQYPEQAELIRAYRQHWIQMITHPIAGSVTLFKAIIDAGWDVTMLTNFHQDTYIEAGKNYNFLELPRGVTVSGEVRLIKPDPAIYQLHAKTFDLEPGGILFFDDSPENVQAALDQGWNARLFLSPELMEKDLVKFGVL